MIVSGNKIIIPVEIAFEDEAKINEMLDKTSQLKQNMSELGVQDKVPEPGLPPPQEAKSEEDSQTLGEVIASGNLMDLDKEDNGLGLKDINKGLQTATQAMNPEAMLLKQIMMLAPEIMPILLAYGLTQEAVDILFEPGGYFDIRFKRYTNKETLGLMSLQDQQRLRIGTMGIIVTAVGGFRNVQGGAFVGSNLRDIKTFGVARIGLQEKITGWRPS